MEFYSIQVDNELFWAQKHKFTQRCRCDPSDEYILPIGAASQTIQDPKGHFGLGVSIQLQLRMYEETSKNVHHLICKTFSF